MKVFTKRILKYNLRSCNVTLLPNLKTTIKTTTTKHGTDTVAYKAAQLWCKLPTR